MGICESADNNHQFDIRMQHYQYTQLMFQYENKQMINGSHLLKERLLSFLKWYVNPTSICDMYYYYDKWLIALSISHFNINKVAH